jgi:hypothetical protein
LKQITKNEAEGMMMLSQWLTIWRAVTLAAVVAIVGFLFLHSYIPAYGLFGNAMVGQVHLGLSCDYGAYRIEGPTQPETLWLCGIDFPYRWVLAALAVFLGAVVVLKRR